MRKPQNIPFEAHCEYKSLIAFSISPLFCMNKALPIGTWFFSHSSYSFPMWECGRLLSPGQKTAAYKQEWLRGKAEPLKCLIICNCPFHLPQSHCLSVTLQARLFPQATLIIHNHHPHLITLHNNENNWAFISLTQPNIASFIVVVS